MGPLAKYNTHTRSKASRRPVNNKIIGTHQIFLVRHSIDHTQGQEGFRSLL